jgi:hypothetical protein
MEKLFFDISKQIFMQVTNMYDFIWPTSVALWNLRWQVKGYIETNPNTTHEELESRFVSGSKIHGVNVQRAFIEHSWEEQQEQFAKFLLINTCALYEAWVKGILLTLKVTVVDFEKQLQFPTEIILSGKKKGVWNVVETINNSESEMLVNAFYKNLLSHKKNSKSKLDNLLICYRYFKEVRNCIIHHNSIADEKAESAYNRFSLITKSIELGTKEIPNYFPSEKDKPIKLSIRGVVGLSDIVLRIIATIDAELSRSANAENEFINRWKSIMPKHVQLNKMTDKRRKQIVGHMLSLGFPSPIRIDQIEKFLKEHGLIF